MLEGGGGVLCMGGVVPPPLPLGLSSWARGGSVASMDNSDQLGCSVSSLHCTLCILYTALSLTAADYDAGQYLG